MILNTPYLAFDIIPKIPPKIFLFFFKERTVTQNQSEIVNNRMKLFSPVCGLSRVHIPLM